MDSVEKIRRRLRRLEKEELRLKKIIHHAQEQLVRVEREKLQLRQELHKLEKVMSV
ncbi:hypothetical protein [Pyrococcus kukulkanii]|uniref:hypothetical protein n=1 Tax=Pyrococcus kukulkanii TaxID=1609559 RepID=UPI000B2F5F1B|nr:hypothetical protein [Pyrococcus kukulkanii]